MQISRKDLAAATSLGCCSAIRSTTRLTESRASGRIHAHWISTGAGSSNSSSGGPSAASLST